jgi:adenylosuccinate synthase
MRDRGKEFGATTGRPRRCGWFDSIMVREAVMLNGISELAIMKMDILDGLKEVKICVAYKYKGKLMREFPHDFEVLSNLKPVYKTLPGWAKSPVKPRSFRELQPNAKAYLARLCDMLKTKISMISIGSARADTIFLD